MSEALPPIADTVPIGARPAAPAEKPATAPAAASTTVEISRAAHAPVYVYKLLDSVTGRTLVQLPFASEGEAAPGARLDTTA